MQKKRESIYYEIATNRFRPGSFYFHAKKFHSGIVTSHSSHSGDADDEMVRVN